MGIEIKNTHTGNSGTLSSSLTHTFPVIIAYYCSCLSCVIINNNFYYKVALKNCTTSVKCFFYNYRAIKLIDQFNKFCDIKKTSLCKNKL